MFSREIFSHNNIYRVKFYWNGQLVICKEIRGFDQKTNSYFIPGLGTMVDYGDIKYYNGRKFSEHYLNVVRGVWARICQEFIKQENGGGNKITIG